MKMLKLVTDEKEIEKHQKTLEEVLNTRLEDEGEFRLGFPGGSWSQPLRYNNDIWFGAFLYEESNIHRFWNGFGLAQDLKNNHNINIITEINIAKKTSRQVQGAFVLDETGNLLLIHRGRLNPGGYKFREWYETKYSKQIQVISDNNREEKVIVIGLVKSDSFVENLTRFIRDVAYFKQYSRQLESDNTTEKSQKNAEDIYSDEDNFENTLSPIKVERTMLVHQRDLSIVQQAKEIANGICQLCKSAAPFENNGEPYLEVHHVKWLADGGADSIKNVVALCPNCHRKMHILNLAEDVTKLTNTAKSQ